jgi:hypothetical protein
MDASKNPAADPRERKVIFFLCVLAAAHVFFFSAAFPFFNIVDEQFHFDLVVRYAQADVPRAIAPAAAESLPFIAIYSTPEYLWNTAAPVPPPPWTQSMQAISDNLRAMEEGWRVKVKNHEAAQPPLYYSLAGAWWRLGKILGLDGGRLLYWLRFFNVPLVAALTWLGWFTAKTIFPENKFIRLAVPALVAVMPQTAFYSINNDILSPLAFGAAFVLLVKIWNAENISPRLAAAAGLALAATFLAKTSDLPLLAVAGTFLALKIFQMARTGKIRASVSSLGILAACAGLPMAAWMAWCKINFGDFTGSAQKIQFLNWAPKPLAEWLHHPIFTLPGLWYFISKNLATLWQGEFLWHRQPLALPAVDLTYVLLTLALLACALVPLLNRRAPLPAATRTALWFGFACFAAVVAFVALLSVKYDFQDCFYPSRARPFFVSGRLLLGALIPFLLLLAFGLDQALKKFGGAAKFGVLTGLLLAMLAAEITIDWHIFPNAYNWFHQ